MRDGSPLPKRIANAPTISMGLELYWNAFMELNSCRNSGWSSGPIPWTAILDYSKAYEFDEIQTMDLFFYTRSMDNAMLEHEAKQNEKNKKPKTTTRITKTSK